MAHAILSPSSAARWLSCPPSARLEAQFPDTAGTAAAEGTLAHELCELELRRRTGELSGGQYDARLADLSKKAAGYSAGMADHVMTYADYVTEQYEASKVITADAVLMIEQRLDLTDYVPDGFGTSDAVIIADGRMTVCDFKYGKGVRVSAYQNRQMMLYALGALRQFGMMYSITTARMVIIQPRLENISTYELPVTELREWADNVLKPTAALAYEGKGEFKAGEHCQFCRAKALCRARANDALELAKYEFRDPALLDNTEIGAILARVERLKSWAKAVEDYALESALNGTQFNGYKLVEGRSVRTYADPDKVAETLINAGYPESILYTRTLLGITAMERAISKKQFDTLLSGLVVKPQGKPTLVPSIDRRPEIGGTNSAQNDFN